MINISDCTIIIGSINSTAYVPTNLTSALLYNGTCSQCICFAFLSINSSIYAAFRISPDATASPGINCSG